MSLQVWEYQPEVQDAVDLVLAQLEHMQKPTIGFHVRGGDKLTEDTKL